MGPLVARSNALDKFAPRPDFIALPWRYSQAIRAPDVRLPQVVFAFEFMPSWNPAHYRLAICRGPGLSRV